MENLLVSSHIVESLPEFLTKLIIATKSNKISWDENHDVETSTWKTLDIDDRVFIITQSNIEDTLLLTIVLKSSETDMNGSTKTITFIKESESFKLLCTLRDILVFNLNKKYFV